MVGITARSEKYVSPAACMEQLLFRNDMTTPLTQRTAGLERHLQEILAITARIAAWLSVIGDTPLGAREWCP